MDTNPAMFVVHKRVFQILVLTILAFAKTTSAQDDAVVEIREYIWHNSEDFHDYGWFDRQELPLEVYSDPSEADPNLIMLNENFTDEVWGWTRKTFGRGDRRLTLNLTNPTPEYCGILNATISIKYYFKNNQTTPEYNFTFVSPVWLNSSTRYGEHAIPLSKTSLWSYITFDLDFSVIKVITIGVWHFGEIFLLDEVRLKIARELGPQCPLSCNEDCDFRKIDCHNYYSCVEIRRKEIYTCEKSKGLAYNPAIKSCDFLANVEECLEPEHCVCEFRPHEGDCSRYFYCSDSCNSTTCEERHCHDGFSWSVTTKPDGSIRQACVLSREATCYGNATAHAFST